MQVRYIQKEELRHCWDFVKQGLDKVRAKGHQGWIAEDIYCDCFEGRAQLWICIIDNKPIGFMVMQPLGDIMHLWAAWLDSSNPKDLEDGLVQAKAIAKQNKCEKLTFSSYRKGWEKVARKLGFTPSTWEIKC